jgi:hypothetical protein
VSVLEFVFCAFFVLFLVSILAGLLAGRVLRWCGRYDDQLSANWKPPEE